jgi:hypothetical protein
MNHLSVIHLLQPAFLNGPFEIKSAADLSTSFQLDFGIQEMDRANSCVDPAEFDSN